MHTFLIDMRMYIQQKTEKRYFANVGGNPLNKQNRCKRVREKDKDFSLKERMKTVRACCIRMRACACVEYMRAWVRGSPGCLVSGYT